MSSPMNSAESVQQHSQRLRYQIHPSEAPHTSILKCGSYLINHCENNWIQARAKQTQQRTEAVWSVVISVPVLKHKRADMTNITY